MHREKHNAAIRAGSPALLRHYDTREHVGICLKGWGAEDNVDQRRSATPQYAPRALTN
jgi:hypothetical protein